MMISGVMGGRERRGRARNREELMRPPGPSGEGGHTTNMA